MADLVIGIDIGGTKIAGGVLDRGARLITRRESRSHAGCLPDQVVEIVVRLVDDLLASSSVSRRQVAGVGAGISGHVHFASGVVLTNSNLPGWEQIPLRDILRSKLGLPVTLDNDANCAAWGEYRAGAGRGARHMAYLTFSTGCGMGIVIDGRLYRGATGTAGEIGHTVVDPNGPLCSCGKRGCLMSYACGMALDQAARDSIQRGEATLLTELCGAKPEHVAAEQIAEAAHRGDALANRLLEEAGRFFGIGLSTVVQVLNPDTIVIGGGLARIGPLILEPSIRALNENIHPVLVDSARVVLSELWNDAGLIGAGAMAWEADGNA